MSEHPIFARFYDRMTAGTERAGLGEMRRELLAGARGRVLELGAGTGHNLPYYTSEVTELVMTEPDPHMASRLRDGLAKEAYGRRQAVRGRVRRRRICPSTTTASTRWSRRWCCARSATRSGRWRRPAGCWSKGGRLLFIEHVRSTSPRRAWWQDRLERPWGFLAAGCHPNRATDQLLAGAGFWIDSIERTKLPKAPPIVRPLIRGVARRPSSVNH